MSFSEASSCTAKMFRKYRPSELSSASTSPRIFASGHAGPTRVARVPVPLVPVAPAAAPVAVAVSEAAAASAPTVPAAAPVTVAVSEAAAPAVPEAATAPVSAVVGGFVSEELSEVALFFLFFIACVVRGVCAGLVRAVFPFVVVPVVLARALFALGVRVVPVVVGFVSAVRHEYIR